MFTLFIFIDRNIFDQAILIGLGSDVIELFEQFLTQANSFRGVSQG